MWEVSLIRYQCLPAVIELLLILVQPVQPSKREYSSRVGDTLYKNVGQAKANF